MRMKEESERASLTLNIKGTKIMASGPIQFSSVQFSCSVMSNSLQPHEPQQAKPPCPSPIPRVHPNSSPLSRWCHPTILSSVIPFSPALNLSQHQGLFKCVSSSHRVAKVLEFQLQHQSFQWTPRLTSLSESLSQWFCDTLILYWS